MKDTQTMPHYSLFIDGEWTEGSEGQTLVSINPANGQPWASFACASPADVERAVVAARAALHGPWGDLTATQRGKLLV